MVDIPRRAIARSWRLAGLPAAHAGRAALGLGKRIGGRPAEVVASEVQARTAAQLFQTLGEMKGGAMKMGQALSAMEAALPAELAGPYVEAMSRLQEAAPPLPTSVVHGVLAEELGDGWRDRFATFEGRPAAAASIGQVHRGEWADGTEVAVKIQYPGAADALLADLGQLDRITPIARFGAPGIDMRALFAQLRASIQAELDYEQEAETQSAFADAFEGDPDVLVPSIIEARPRVLVSEWLDGRPLREVITDGTVAERDRAGTLLLRFLLCSPERVGRIHGDPHPGNFRLLADGRLGVLDFGSSETMLGWPDALGRLLGAGRDGNAALMHGIAVEIGLIDADTIAPERLMSLFDPWMVPLREPRFHFGRAWLQQEVRTWSDPRGAGSRLQRKVHVPTHHLLVQRVAFGLLGVLTSLDSTVEVRSEMQRWIPSLVP